MKIYIEAKKINEDLLNHTIKEINNYKLIYSDDGIYKIFKDNIYKINIIDKPIKYFSINGNTLLIDESKINYEKNITTIPFRHKLKNINEVNYKLNRELSLKILYNNNSQIDYYFETKLIDNNTKNTISEYIKLFN